MRGLVALSIANLRSFVRDRAALFWTLAFPVIFVILFGTIFSGAAARTSRSAGSTRTARPASAPAARRPSPTTRPLELTDGTLEESRASMLAGDLDGDPRGARRAWRRRSRRARAGRPGAGRGDGHHGPQPLGHASQAIQQVATGVVMAANLQLSGATPLLTVDAESLQTNRLNSVSFFVPSILAMALMQLGIFAADPARRAAREADPQAAQRDAAAALDARRARTSSCGCSSPPPRP